MDQTRRARRSLSGGTTSCPCSCRAYRDSLVVSRVSRRVPDVATETNSTRSCLNRSLKRHPMSPVCHRLSQCARGAKIHQHQCGSIGFPRRLHLSCTTDRERTALRSASEASKMRPLRPSEESCVCLGRGVGGQRMAVGERRGRPNPGVAPFAMGGVAGNFLKVAVGAVEARDVVYVARFGRFRGRHARHMHRVMMPRHTPRPRRVEARARPVSTDSVPWSPRFSSRASSRPASRRTWTAP